LSSVWFVVSLCIGIGAILAGAVFLGRRWAKGETAKAVSEAQTRMADVRNSSDSTTADRMSDGRF